MRKKITTQANRVHITGTCIVLKLSQVGKKPHCDNTTYRDMGNQITYTGQEAVGDLGKGILGFTSQLRQDGFTSRKELATVFMTVTENHTYLLETG